MARKDQSRLVDEFQDTNHRQQHLIEIISDKPGSFFAVGDAAKFLPIPWSRRNRFPLCTTGYLHERRIVH
jgi:hypothetical protein